MDRTEALRSTEGEDPGGHLHQVSKKSPERGDSGKHCPVFFFNPCIGFVSRRTGGLLKKKNPFRRGTTPLRPEL
ncbi:hypothetical protein GDO78_018622 [Eleutherodactylus coqui]|uniref:Uncharacterized protein n=1 Tax=Eleutherodactylus coqui TaxID=57060 RepID=A0A8J6E5R7_ELECQ|nr:hypothetical protein GDO78_018622 [Eleutherodactylus coqui]